MQSVAAEAAVERFAVDLHPRKMQTGKRCITVEKPLRKLKKPGRSSEAITINHLT